MLRINKYSNEHILLSEENCNVYIPLTESNKFLDTNIFTDSVGSSIVENNSKAVQNNHLASIEDLPEIISEEYGTHAHLRKEHQVYPANEWGNNPFNVSITSNNSAGMGPYGSFSYSWTINIYSTGGEVLVGDYFSNFSVSSYYPDNVSVTKFNPSGSNCVGFSDSSAGYVSLGCNPKDGYEHNFNISYVLYCTGGKPSDWKGWNVEYDEAWYLQYEDATCEIADCPYRLAYEEAHPELPDLPDEPTEPVTPSENTPSVSDNNGENHYGENQEISVSVNLDTEAIVSAIPSDSSNYRVVDIFLTSSIVGVLLGYILFRRIS